MNSQKLLSLNTEIFPILAKTLDPCNSVANFTIFAKLCTLVMKLLILLIGFLDPTIVNIILVLLTIEVWQVSVKIFHCCISEESKIFSCSISEV